MSRRPPPPTHDAADAAIERVLAAEREAQDAVARATTEAATIVETARSTARSIAERTERRIHCLREAFAARAAREIAALDVESAAQDAARELSPDDLARLDRAVAALCAELTSAPP